VRAWIIALTVNFLASTLAFGLELEELDSFLSGLPSVQGRPLEFREYRYSSLFQEAMVLEGELHIDEQGALVKQLYTPMREKMVIGTREFSLETPARSYRTGLSRSPFLKALSAGLRGLLNRDAEAILSVFEAELDRTGPDWIMTLVPRETSLRKYMDRLEVAGCTGQVSMVNIHTGRDERHEMIFPEALEACAQ